MTALMLAFALGTAATLGYQLRKLLTNQRLDCFHHDVHVNRPDAPPVESYIRSQLIETGMRKRFTCLKCDGVWFT